MVDGCALGPRVMVALGSAGLGPHWLAAREFEQPRTARSGSEVISGAGVRRPSFWPAGPAPRSQSADVPFRLVAARAPTRESKDGVLCARAAAASGFAHRVLAVRPNVQ